jgi:hypothetical protein
MTPADRARNNAISLEAKKDALAQRQNGDWKVSFTVQGIDMDTRLTQAPMGTRYAVVLVEIGDDEQPVQKEARAKPRQSNPPSPHPDGAARPKMDWRDVQPAAQAAMQCEKPEFWAFLREEFKYPYINHPDLAAVAVRTICGVKSRSELGTNHKARILWKHLDDQFHVWRAKERVGA